MLVCLHTMPVATAEEMWLLGAEGGGKYSYAYLGYMAPLQLDAEGEYYQRYWVDWVDYKYSSEGTEVHARAPGAEAVYGKRVYHQGQRNVTVFVGVSYRDTNVDPDDIDVDVSGRQIGAKLQLEADSDGPRYRLEGIASYIAGLDTYWTRGRIWKSSRSANGIGYGSELVLQGDSEYFAAQLGVLVGNLRFGESGRWLFKAGVRHVKDQGEYGYVGLEALLQK